jgi:hypothetical protein
MSSDAKIAAYYKDAAAGTSELVHMDPFDYREAKRKWPDAWSLEPFAGLKQITAHRFMGEVYGHAVQSEPDGPYVLTHANGRSQKVDPKTGAVIGPKAPAPIAPVEAEQPRRASQGKAEGAAPSMSNWDSFINAEGVGRGN